MANARKRHNHIGKLEVNGVMKEEPREVKNEI